MVGCDPGLVMVGCDPGLGTVDVGGEDPGLSVGCCGYGVSEVAGAVTPVIGKRVRPAQEGLPLVRRYDALPTSRKKPP
jgi:hypothetical protein